MMPTSNQIENIDMVFCPQDRLVKVRGGRTHLPRLRGTRKSAPKLAPGPSKLVLWPAWAAGQRAGEAGERRRGAGRQGRRLGAPRQVRTPPGREQ